MLPLLENYALKQSFSARKVEFGKETTYNDFVDVIQNADARIKSVALNVPNYDIQRITLDKSGIYPSSAPSELEKVYLVARMILAGNVQLFEFDDDFDYEFGQKELSTPSYNAFKNSGSPIKSITSSTTTIRTTTSTAIASTRTSTATASSTSTQRATVRHTTSAISVRTSSTDCRQSTECGTDTSESWQTRSTATTT